MEISGFYNLSVEERLEFLKKALYLNEEDILVLKKGLDIGNADMMIENVLGMTQLPLGIATHFRINGQDVLIPMAIEESSVVAAASHAAKLCLPDGFTAEADEPVMTGLVQLVGVDNAEGARDLILSRQDEIKEICNKKDSTLVKAGGGLKGIGVDIVDTRRGRMVVAKFYVNVCDAMGANAVNTMCETAAPFLEGLAGGRAVMKIVSNLATRRLVRASATWSKEALGGGLIEGMLDAHAFAESYPYRAATNNKGIMNGIDAVLVATGNDWRAAEAGAHSYAAVGGNGYAPLAKYRKDEAGNLVGGIELPLPVGIVGGATKMHPVAQLSLKILGVRCANDLAMTAACVGLANNFAAMRAIVKEGINRGHMELHAKNIAVMAGAHGADIDLVEKRMVSEGNISVNRASEILNEIRQN